MPSIKPPNVAGTFYPDDAGKLRRLVREFLAGKEPENILPRAIIAPHAGYRFSGEVAGAAYASVRNGREIFKRVVILATPHRLYFPGIAVSGMEYFETPLGEVEVDGEGVKLAASAPSVQLLDQAFEEEHSLEVQLPFLQEVLDDFKIVPLLIGPAEPAVTADLLESLITGERTLVVVSSDLSHFLPDAEACALDGETSEMIERLAPAELDGRRACGFSGIQGLLCYAARHGLKARTVALSNSGRTGGELSRVVGYGAYVVSKM